jgi:hypothetical protein
MAPLRLREGEPRDDPPRLRRIVVLDRGLETLAQRVGLPELASEPAQQADLRRSYTFRAQRSSSVSTV